MKQIPKQCGSCQHFHNKTRTLCKRYPPVSIDNRHARYPAVCWDDWCGEWTLSEENIPENAPFRESIDRRGQQK